MRLASNVRAIDLPCRYGGEEFVVVMPDTDDRRAPIRWANGCARTLLLKISRSAAAIPSALPHSVGISTLERGDDTPETIYKRADNALYAAKRRGRNRVAADAA